MPIWDGTLMSDKGRETRDAIDELMADVACVDSIEATLIERGSRYGDFKGHAKVTRAIKRAMIDSENWGSLPDEMQEALDMVAHKIGRILNGDPEYKDSWTDVIGYTALIERELSE